MPLRKISPAKFSAGDSVRVKPGIADPDYPDFPIGGWVGRIAEVEAGNLASCLVRWTQTTLDAMNPIYRNRCDRDGLDAKAMWLAEDDLEPDTGQRIAMEQPPKAQAKPLDMKDQDDRIRAVFGLTHDDPLPSVESDTLRIYRDFLAENLSLPFEAEAKMQPKRSFSSPRKVTVVGLGSPDEDERLDEHYGLICEIKLGKKKGDVPLSDLEIRQRGSERQLVEDYRCWFSNWR